jgi:hypothetical protein
MFYGPIVLYMLNCINETVQLTGGPMFIIHVAENLICLINTFHFCVRCVTEHFCYICLLCRAIAGLSYGRFIAIRYKFKLSTYIQEPLVAGRRGALNGQTVSST